MENKLLPVNRKSTKRNIRNMIYALALIILAILWGYTFPEANINDTLAFLSNNPMGNESSFEVGVCEIRVDSDEGEVFITNTGTADIYVRAVVNVLGKGHKDTSFTGLPGNRWDDSYLNMDGHILKGFYYYEDKLYPGESTESLFTGVNSLAGTATTDDVSIFAECLQADSKDSFEEAWCEYLN